MDKISRADIVDAIGMTALRNKFHPVKDFLNYACDEVGHDGVKRVETMFIRHLGMKDTSYARQTARMVMIASVARIMEPGCKFDFAPVLQGEQGLLKSTFIETLYGSEFFGELTCNLRETQRVAEAITGVWGMEMPEMSAMHKSDHNDAKQFLSAKVDRIRMAYDRRISFFKRTTVFWGTTNDTVYLKDPTGNRRWWPLIVEVEEIDIAALKAERTQLWAEAFAMYREMRAVQPHGQLPLYLSDPEAAAEAARLQGIARVEQTFELWANQIDLWLNEPLKLSTLRNQYGISGEFDAENDPMVVRVAFTREDVEKHLLGLDRAVMSDVAALNIGKALAHLRQWDKEVHITGNKNSVRRFGQQQRWIVRRDATKAELKLGYRAVADQADDSDDLV